MIPAIRFTGVRKRFGAKRVLDGVTLDVAEGTSMVVIGASGSGKSVLLKCALGLLPMDGGTIEVFGRDHRRTPPGTIGMLFQNAALFDSLPVWENVVFALLAERRLKRADGPARAEGLLAQVGLGRDILQASPADLSGGMQKRVALARAIAAEPKILFFDEPTTGLDPITAAVIDTLIADTVRRLGATAVAITHDMPSAQRIGDGAAFLLDGRIAWQGRAADLMASGDAAVDQFTHGRADGPIGTIGRV